MAIIAIAAQNLARAKQRAQQRLFVLQRQLPFNFHAESAKCGAR